ncbi:MAG: D-lyxose/D-mannose family sugar isomerase [Terracidiphilus sp.]|nr:D-lyxose/D-mannose family sugar isomerase [Terracidiphilus sp.]
MKRSEINHFIQEAAAFFAGQQFALPPFAQWTPQDWITAGHEANEIRDRMLGWDVTDFNSGRFEEVGLTLFTVRNGGYKRANISPKPYAEKIMYVLPGQVTPMHFHHRKTEDIINRGGETTGKLAVQLYNAAPDDSLANTSVLAICDGIERSVKAGGTVVLGPGESITLTPRLYHKFYAIDRPAIIGEVSSVNADVDDNRFLEPLPRFPEIVEDELAWRLLCTEYPAAR